MNHNYYYSNNVLEPRNLNSLALNNTFLKIDYTIT